VSTQTIPDVITNLSQNVIENGDFEPQAEICKALANAQRLRILDQLSQAECSATSLQKSLSMSRANLSQHTSVLKSVGLIAKRREGNTVHFSLAVPEVKQAFQVLRNLLHARLAGSKRLWA
jgi:DNA-binding transcriptional ArsR family regulator